MNAAGFRTVAVGKNHFCSGEADCERLHGFDEHHLYDGLETEWDEYRQWFNTTSGGQWWNATAPGWDPGRPLTNNDWRGAAYAYPEAWHNTAWTGRVAAKVVANHSGNPLFLKTSFHSPHSPYDPPARLLATFDDAKAPSRLVADDGWDVAATPCDVSAVNYTLGDPRDTPTDLWCADMRADLVAASRSAYLASVQFVDEQVGAVLDALDARGWGDDAFVIYSADHGDALGDHYLWRKTYAYESSARIPCIVRPGAVVWTGRGAPPASIAGAVTEIRDVLPTILDAVGATGLVPADQPLDGASLLPLLRGDKTGWRDVLDLEHSKCYNASNHWSGLVTVDRKYPRPRRKLPVFWRGPVSGDRRLRGNRGRGAATTRHLAAAPPRPATARDSRGRTRKPRRYVFHALTGREQLFDLDEDPDELRDVAAARPNETAAFRARLVAQYEREGRGDAWVKDGVLVWPRDDMVYSPNYPNASRA